MEREMQGEKKRKDKDTDKKGKKDMDGSRFEAGPFPPLTPTMAN
jgi:hypothetical protein